MPRAFASGYGDSSCRFEFLGAVVTTFRVIDRSLHVGRERVPNDGCSAADRDEGVADGSAWRKSFSLVVIALRCLRAVRRRFGIVTHVGSHCPRNREAADAGSIPAASTFPPSRSTARRRCLGSGGRYPAGS